LTFTCSSDVLVVTDDPPFFFLCRSGRQTLSHCISPTSANQYQVSQSLCDCRVVMENIFEVTGYLTMFRTGYFNTNKKRALTTLFGSKARRFFLQSLLRKK